MEAGSDVSEFEDCEQDSQFQEVPEELRRKMMPSCFDFAGLQHLMDNLLRVNLSQLPMFEPMWNGLKAIVAMLRVTERRMRFVNRCVDGTRYSYAKKKFERFKGSLYENRWREVVSFIRQIKPLFPEFTLCFSAAKSSAGVITSGRGREEQQAAQDRQDEQAGFTKMDPMRSRKR